jgi:HTH-type transcriptional regulator/antitoxin HigA
MTGESADPFIDDLSLREVRGANRGIREVEADQWAENALIPEDIWNASRVKRAPTPLAVMELAQSLSIHPAIIAGRVRHETGNYRLLSQFVGTGFVRKQLMDQSAAVQSAR